MTAVVTNRINTRKHISIFFLFKFLKNLCHCRDSKYDKNITAEKKFKNLKTSYLALTFSVGFHKYIFQFHAQNFSLKFFFKKKICNPNFTQKFVF